MKSFETTMNDTVYLNKDYFIEKIDFREPWSMNIKAHKDMELYFDDCFFSNLLNEFKMCQPRDFDELHEILKPSWKEWDMKERGYVYEIEDDSFKVGLGLSTEDSEDKYYWCSSPVFTFTIKANKAQY
jgi:hypothetical protein